MLSKKMTAIIVSLLLFSLFISFTNPNQVNLGVILIPFVLLGVIFYILLNLLLEKFFKNTYRRKKIKLFSLIGALLIVNFMLLSSIGQLTPQDTILTVLITVIASFYLYKFQLD